MRQENELDVKKAFEAIAYILGQRTNVKITVKEVQQKEDTKESV